jgi:predicted GNAT family acetyltransferase
VSENVKAAPLTLANLDTLCNNWKYYQPEFKAEVAKMIQSNMSVGIFLNHPERKEETLAAMVLQAEYWGIGLLITLPEHRRKGLAALALSHLIQDLGKKGITPFSLNATENEASSTIFTKLGFKKRGLYQWIRPVKIENW